MVPPRDAVLGIPISRTSYEDVLELVARRPRERTTRFAFCNVHSVMEARRSPALADALGRMDVATSDGVPIVWALRLLAGGGQGRVYGPDLMRLALRHGVALGWRHYFYGATPDTLTALTEAAERLAPGVRIVGSYAPPFRPLTASERAVDLTRIREARPDLCWVGLGMPKQELWMAQVQDSDMPGIALLGVGAAFDLVSGRVPTAPAWMQRAGLEWVYRLVREPRRLWRRYLLHNPVFVALLVSDLVRRRTTRVAARPP